MSVLNEAYPSLQVPLKGNGSDGQFDIKDAVDPSGHLMQIPLAKHDGMHCDADVEPVPVVVIPSVHAVHEVALYLSL